MRRRILAGGAIVLLAAALAGCGEPANDVDTSLTDNTSQVCADYWSVYGRYTTGDAPERAALSKAVTDSYKGLGKPGAERAAAIAYYRAWANDLHPLADRAQRPELRSALTDQVAVYERYAEQGPPVTPDLKAGKELMAVAAICPAPADPSPTP